MSTSTRRRTTVATPSTRNCYEVSTIETLRYAKEHDGKGYFSFTVPAYALRKQNNGGFKITVYAEAHIRFTSRNLSSSWVIREITQEITGQGNDKIYTNVTPNSKWRKLPTVKFVDSQNNEILPEGLEALGLTEEIEI